MALKAASSRAWSPVGTGFPCPATDGLAGAALRFREDAFELTEGKAARAADALLPVLNASDGDPPCFGSLRLAETFSETGGFDSFGEFHLIAFLVGTARVFFVGCIMLMLERVDCDAVDGPSLLQQGRAFRGPIYIPPGYRVKGFLQI